MTPREKQLLQDFRDLTRVDRFYEPTGTFIPPIKLPEQEWRMFMVLEMLEAGEEKRKPTPRELASIFVK